jgi:hypothetical protein
MGQQWKCRAWRCRKDGISEMLKNNCSARLQGAMALVACATEELQRLRPLSWCAADAVIKTASCKDYPELSRTGQPIPPLCKPTGLKRRCESSKIISLTAKATTHKNPPKPARVPNDFSARGSTAGLKNHSKKSKLIPSAAQAALSLRRLRRG